MRIAELLLQGAGGEPIDFAEWVRPTRRRDLQALLQVHILGLELVELR
jgi:hypothetical protein